jgi:hypothetical protein
MHAYSDRVFYAGDLLFHSFSKGSAGDCRFNTALGQMAINAVHPIGICMEGIVAQFVLYPKRDEQRAADPNDQTGDIDEGEAFVPDKATNRDLQVVKQHGYGLVGLVKTIATLEDRW